MDICEPYTECVNESGDMAAELFLDWLEWRGFYYCHPTADFKAFQLQWSHGLEHKVLLL
jgi:hypothetical protein